MKIDIIKDAAAALKKIEEAGIPVQQGWYDENIKKCHVTLWNIGEVDIDFSDDGAEGEKHQIQITIFSQKDEVKLARQIKALMLNNDFSYDGRNADEAAAENGIYMKAQRFSKIYETEE